LECWQQITFFSYLSSPPPAAAAPPPAQIVFESRLGTHDVLNDCMMTVDGTDFRIPQKGAAMKGNAFASHKYAGKSALRYELGVDILAGNLVWIQGPYPAGKYTDIEIFNKVLRNFLEPGERVEADEGYRGQTRQNQMSWERRESGGESGDAGESLGASRDAEWAAEELEDPLSGIPPQHHEARRCVPGVRGGDAAHRRER
jgi:hypothetical protein